MKKTNILYILADQLRPDFCGCYGADWLKTPNIDKLAKESVKYNCAVTPSPACVPARASLLTGKSPMENRVLDNAKWLRPDHDEMGIKTWAEILVENGYRTYGIGKMHFYPWDICEGFQYRVIAEDKRHYTIQDDYTVFLKENGYERLHGSASEGYYEHLGATVSYLPEKYQIDRFVCDKTCDYLNFVGKDQPFAMFVGFPGPHCPYDPSQEKFDNMPKDTTMPKSAPNTKDSEMFRPQNTRDNKMPWNGVDLTNITKEQIERVRRHYSALVQAIDDYVGEIIQKLKDEDLYDSTAIIFTADHGDYLGDYSMMGKGHFYDSATRIPLLVKYPNQQPKEYNHIVSLTDTFNTVLKFAGLNVVDTKDSTVLAPFGESEKRPAVFGANNLGWMLRDDKYQYTVYFNGVRELYDYIEDTQQQHNLIECEQYKEIANKMRTELESRVFEAINAGNSDLTVKSQNLNTEEPSSPFNFKFWNRPYPHKI